MIQTIQDVFERRAEILAEFDRMSDPTSRSEHYFDHSELEEAVVLPDAVALRLLEFTYLLNTEFIPGRLPGNGMCIGDVITHEGKTYLTFHVDVALHNLHMLRLVRPLEPICRSWAEQKQTVSAKVADFLAALRVRDPECLGVKLFQSADEWHKTYAGLAYIGTPSPEFVDVLDRFPQLLRERTREDLDDLLATAAALADELRPYVNLPKSIQELRNKNRHKGCPRVDMETRMLLLNSPSASGGASLHTLPAGDDLLNSLPAHQSLFIIACQAGRTGMPHIGGGKLQGIHYVFLPPATPFFPMVQERIERDSSFAAAWETMAASDPEGERWDEWRALTEPLKIEVIREVVPQLIRDRVLGFQVDLVSKDGVGILRPVVAEAHIQHYETFSVPLTRPSLEGLLLETTKGYGFPESVFDVEPAAAESDERMHGVMSKARPKVLVVEDNRDHLRHIADGLGERVTLLKASSLEEGERLFAENPDIALVVMDACVPGDSPNAMPLVRKIRKTFTGPIIASSSYDKYRKILVTAGCDHEADKFEVPELVVQLLNV